MKTLRHPVAALVIFAVMISLILGAYDGLKQSYGFSEDSESQVDGFNIARSLNQLTIVTGINETMSSVYELSSPTATSFDVLGALASAGIGVVKTIGGLIIFPVQITSIIVQYYEIPGIIITGFAVLIVVYIAFILVSAYLRSDI